MVVTGDYRPPPYLDLDVITEDSINSQGSRLISTLKERGSRSGRAFFERVTGVEAVAREDATQKISLGDAADRSIVAETSDLEIWDGEVSACLSIC